LALAVPPLILDQTFEDSHNHLSAIRWAFGYIFSVNTSTLPPKDDTFLIQCFYVRLIATASTSNFIQEGEKIPPVGEGHGHWQALFICIHQRECATKKQIALLGR
jgi:hypothetical protein